MRVLIVGCGYVGLPLGAELAGKAMTFLASAAVGITPLLADVTRPETPEPLNRLIAIVRSR